MKKIIAIFIISILSASFQLLAQEILISGGEWVHSVPAVACNGTSFQVVWSDNRFDDWRYYGVQVEYDGTVGDEHIIVGPSSNIYQNTELCSNGSDFMMVWSRYQTTGCPSYIYGQLIETWGVPSGSYFRIDLSNPGIISKNPKVCANGTDYITVWTQGSFPFFKPVAQRIDLDGTLIGGNIEIEQAINTYSNPNIAFDGSHYLCVWNTIINGSISIRGRLLTPEGTFFGNKLDITSSDNAQQCVSIAYADSTFLVVWEEYSFFTNQSHIYGQFISRQCTLIGEDFLISGNSNVTERNPRISTTGNSYLVTWQQDNSDNSQNLYAQILDLNGEPAGEPYEIMSDYQQVVLQYNACASHDKYLIVWEEVQDSLSSYIKGFFIDDLPVSINDEAQECKMKVSIFPQPVCNTSVVRYTLKHSGDIRITIFNIKGQKIHESILLDQSVGDHVFKLSDMLDYMNAGIYFLIIKTENESKIEKLLFFQN